MKKSIKVFGTALDATDFPLSLQIKLNYLNQLAQNIQIDPNFLDPYDGLLHFSQVLSKDTFHKIGKFPIETWLTPRPKLEDLPLMNQKEFQNFTKKDAIRKYSEELVTYLKESIFPDFPLMIGVDHSLTGGVLNALSHEYGSENFLILIFDAHFDGLPAKITLNIAKYMSDHPDEQNPLITENIDAVNKNSDPIDRYTCASFLYYLLEENIIIPENLLIFGCQDYPDANFRSINDSRIQKYVEFYDKMEEKGVKFIPKANSSSMLKQLSTSLEDIDESNIYISFDTDVGALREIIATRFRNAIGIDQATILDASKVIKNAIIKKNINLIGLDIMEIETHLLNKVFPKSGRKDQTVEVVDNFLNIFF